MLELRVCGEKRLMRQGLESQELVPKPEGNGEPREGLEWERGKVRLNVRKSC